MIFRPFSDFDKYKIIDNQLVEYTRINLFNIFVPEYSTLNYYAYYNKSQTKILEWLEQMGITEIEFSSKIYNYYVDKNIVYFSVIVPTKIAVMYELNFL